MGEQGAFDWTPVRRAYFAGEYGECRRLLENAPAPEAEIWLSRIDGRQVRYADAIARLLRLSPSDSRTAAERDMWLAASYANTGEFPLAHQLLDRALLVLRAPDEAYYRAIYIRALAYYLAADYTATAAAIEELFESPHPQDRAQAHALRSWIAARREDFRAQLNDLLKSLEEYEAVEEPDQYGFANTLLSIAALCRELPTEGIVDRLRKAWGRVRSGEATASSRFQLLRVLGWIEALQGDEISAMRYWRVAEKDAPSEYWRVFCLVDRAYLASVSDRKEAARETLAAAHQRASLLAWGSTRDEERVILLTMAQLFAEDDPALAQRYLAVFRSLPTQMHSRMGWVGDRRTRALQLYPHGIALLHLNEQQAAIGMLEEAWTIFTSFEYGWRAALAALTLHTATGEPQWLQRAREQIAPWPQSWIARKVRKTE